MKQFYRFVGSKGFILPMVGWPFLWIVWLFVDGGGFGGDTDAVEEVPAEEVGEGTGAGDSGEVAGEFDFSQFMVSEEEFQSATGGGGEEDAEPVIEVSNLHETLTDETGKYAIMYFVWVLSLSPLKVLFRRNKLVSALNRHRRTVGLAAFFYASLHLGVYLTNGLATVVDELTAFILYILAGWIGYLGMLILAVTSNNWSQRKLGGRKWKKLHRVAYLLIPVLFYHQAFTGKYDWGTVREALFWFSPLILLQPLRVYVDWKKKADKKASAP